MDYMDRLNFDGSCDPNPGGRMGFGWVITWKTKRSPTEGSKEKRKSPTNTNNVAEYTALKEGILNYLKLKGKGPLQVCGDSKLVINQMSGKWKINNKKLADIHGQINEIIKKNDLKIKYKWVPRNQNADADRLAMPAGKQQAKIREVKPADRKVIADTNTASVSPRLRVKINELNTNPSPGFKEFARLKVGGRDSFSSKRIEELEKLAGKDATKLVKKEFSSDLKNQASALRWMLRGLAADLAVQKVKVDAEISKKREKKMRKR
ncbi:ribonuclease HI family protein [Methanolobus zinderi]|uniref:Ribonuclease HI family protein n=1 Tax=Methanolobus zinderi TaxID=536044 RepID=A0A7D5IPB5_9EURY|nr:ribonuclease HI family protein [Methanolobus zinderi]QLC50185.1 ribonuclease HI family protein [Methanolobus zinderi]